MDDVLERDLDELRELELIDVNKHAESLVYKIAVPMMGLWMESQRDLRKLWTDLSKRSRSNVKLVAPKHMGKSVLLKGLCKVARENAKPYLFVV